jgi:hypothetical protein
VDILVAESERLRRALLVAAQRLNTFADELIMESREEGIDDERGEDPGEE